MNSVVENPTGKFQIHQKMLSKGKWQADFDLPLSLQNSASIQALRCGH
jgi:hypothetical protein